MDYQYNKIQCWYVNIFFEKYKIGENVPNKKVKLCIQKLDQLYPIFINIT